MEITTDGGWAHGWLVAANRPVSRQLVRVMHVMPHAGAGRRASDAAQSRWRGWRRSDRGPPGPRGVQLTPGHAPVAVVLPSHPNTHHRHVLACPRHAARPTRTRAAPCGARVALGCCRSHAPHALSARQRRTDGAAHAPPRVRLEHRVPAPSARVAAAAAHAAASRDGVRP